MKRITALILCLITVLSLFACATEENTTATADIATKEETKKTEESREPQQEQTSTGEAVEMDKNRATTVVDKTAKAQLAAIPVANDSMSEDELRKICLDFMRLQLSFQWTPSETFKDDKMALPREKGYVYGGLPYISSGAGSLYRVLHYFDEETGVVNVTPFQSRMDFFSNACSGGAFWGWFRVVNSFWHERGAWTQTCTEQAGCVKVGNYVIPKDVSMYSSVRSTSPDKFTCQNVVEANSKQTMFEAYALAKPADGVVHPGHVRMVSTVPVVKRNADGTINGDESYLCCHEQIKYISDRNKVTLEDGSSYYFQGGVDRKYTFNDLIEKYYIPFTFKEFLGTDPVEPSQATIGITDGSVSLQTLSSATLKTNYMISDIFLTITDGTGKEVFNRISWMDDHFTKEKALSKDLLTSSVIKYLEKYATGEYTVTLSVQLSNGEKPSVYSGILTN